MGERWRNLVGNALAWQYGIELDARQEAIDFSRFRNFGGCKNRRI